MLDQKYLENNLESVREKVNQRGMELDLEKLREINGLRKQVIGEVETLEHERNQGSKKVGELKRDGADTDADKLSKELKLISEKIKDLNGKRGELEQVGS